MSPPDIFRVRAGRFPAIKSIKLCRRQRIKHRMEPRNALGMPAGGYVAVASLVSE